jgi:hypothetical protein
MNRGPQTATATIELDPGPQAPNGVLTDGQGQARRFSGWIELAAAIEDWRTSGSTRRPAYGPRTAHTTYIKGDDMNLYAIRRRDFWGTPEELQATAVKSAQVGEEMADDVRWIRTYVVQEQSGKLGTVCIYQGTSPEKVREQAERTGMPADEITLVADTVIVRPDPAPATA